MRAMWTEGTRVKAALISVHSFPFGLFVLYDCLEGKQGKVCIKTLEIFVTPPQANKFHGESLDLFLSALMQIKVSERSLDLLQIIIFLSLILLTHSYVQQKFFSNQENISQLTAWG